MTSSSESAETPETRTKRQARELQALIAQLLVPPMEPHDHPFPDAELSPREIKVLLLLGDSGEMIMTDLAAALLAPLSTVTRIIDRLQDKGFVSRSRSEEDRRIVVVKPAENGKRLRESIRQAQLQMAGRMLEPLTPGEREILLELMGKLVRGLKTPQI